MMLTLVLEKSPPKRNCYLFTRSKRQEKLLTEASLQNQEKVAKDRQRKAQRKTKKDV
jgi:hypothetical protein